MNLGSLSFHLTQFEIEGDIGLVIDENIDHFLKL